MTDEYTATATSVESPFLTTPFEEYSVTEGFLLLFLIALVVCVIYRFVRRFV